MNYTENALNYAKIFVDGELVREEDLVLVARNIQQIIDDTIEKMAQEVEDVRRFYPENVFIPPEPGQHGKTVDACSAAAIRSVLPAIATRLRMQHSAQQRFASDT